MSKVGTSFVKGAVFTALFVTADVVCSYAVPFVRDVLDTPDPQHVGAKLVFLAASALVYLLATLGALRLSQARFEKLDIR